MKPSNNPAITVSSYRAPAAGIDNLYAVGIINLTVDEMQRMTQFAYELQRQRNGMPAVSGARVSVYDPVRVPEPEPKPPGNRFSGLDFDVKS